MGNQRNILIDLILTLIHHFTSSIPLLQIPDCKIGNDREEGDVYREEDGPFDAFLLPHGC